jgi:hypothetical protein
MNKYRIIAIALSAFAFCPSAIAQTPDSLTPEIVQGFVDSIHDLREISKRYNAEEIMSPTASGDKTMAQTATPFSTAITTIQGHQAFNEMQATILKHGFSDMQSWGAIGDRIMKAFAANGMDSEMPQMDEQMKQALEQIESSDLTEKQKENMRQMMQSSMQLMNSYVNAPETDKAAVLPYMSVIENLSHQ